MTEALRQWLAKNLERFKAHSVQLHVRMPERDDRDQSGGAIGFTFQNIILDFAAWDRRPYETTVIVLNTDNDAEFFKDEFIDTLDGVIARLDRVVDNLLSGKYKDMTQASKPHDF